MILRCSIAPSNADSPTLTLLSWSGSPGDDIPSYEIRYEFESRKAFETYEANHAPRLREEGLAKFPLTLGLEYQRSIGETVNTQN